MVNYFKFLGVNIDSSEEEIKSKYKDLAKKYHPDKPGGSNEKFKELKEACDTLVDPVKRKEYLNNLMNLTEPLFTTYGSFGRKINHYFLNPKKTGDATTNNPLIEGRYKQEKQFFKNKINIIYY